jgi:hypothetical protein
VLFFIFFALTSVKRGGASSQRFLLFFLFFSCKLDCGRFCSYQLSVLSFCLVLATRRELAWCFSLFSLPLFALLSALHRVLVSTSCDYFVEAHSFFLKKKKRSACVLASLNFFFFFAACVVFLPCGVHCLTPSALAADCIEGGYTSVVESTHPHTHPHTKSSDTAFPPPLPSLFFFFRRELTRCVGGAASLSTTLRPRFLFNITFRAFLFLVAMNYEKPGGAMHEVIRRAFDELRLHNNPQGAITIVTHALANADSLPPLSGGKEYNGDVVASSSSNYARPAETSTTANSGGSNGCGDGGSRLRPTGSGARGGQNSASTMQWFAAGPVGVAIASPSPTNYSASSVSLPTGSAEWMSKRHVFNRTQLLRLLLIRCEAFSVLKQHARALQDAEKAVEVSQGQSAEAYFNVGREQRRQFNVVESASAFDTGEALLQSMQQAIAAGKIVVDGWSPETSSDEAFWADRGFQMDEVRDMGITRREYEAQERNSHRTNLGNSSSGPTSPILPGAGHNTFRGEPQTPLSGANRTKRGGNGNINIDRNSFSASPYEGQVSQGNSVTTRSTNLNTSVVLDNGSAVAAAAEEESTPTSYVTDLLQCGMSPNELSMWRRLANESRALLAMQQSHTVPSTVLSSTMTLLDRRISGTRGGLIISIENNTHTPLRFVGALAPEGLYHESYSFPDAISKAHCGVSMLHPRGWGGYSGAVCYELHENLCCFLYFDSPLLGSVKYGVRFVDLRASDLRRAYAEVYKETGVYGIAGGTTTAAIAPPTPVVIMSSMSSANGFGNLSGISGGAGRAAPTGVSIRGASTPLTTTVASMNAARAAIRMPPSNTWVVAHTASSASQRPVKASSRMLGGQTIAFSLGEVLAVRLRSVELIPALEYVGAVTLKKISSVSRRYRELVNHLPPPMFYGSGRRSYPDYCVGSDRYVSPWIVRDAQPVTWKLIFDGRMADQEEFSISDEADMQKHILCFSADAQTKVTGYVYLGDKRCLQYIIKESWIPFSNTLYLTTPIGRTFASCVAMNNQSQYTLSLTSSTNQGTSSSNSNGNNTANGGGARQGDDVLYTARKRVHPANGGVARATPVNATTVTAGTEASVAVKKRVSPSSGALASQSHTSVPPTGVVDTSGGCGSGGSATRNGGLHHSSPGHVVLATSVVGTAVTGKSASPQPPTMASGSPAASSIALTSTVNSGGGASSVAVSPTAVAAAAAFGTPTTPEYFTIWRSQRVSGGALAGGAAPSTTNGGADIIAEVKVNSVLYGMVTKGYCAAEITLYPGADAMLVSLLSFLISRW